jgi:hypothetical protein
VKEATKLRITFEQGKFEGDPVICGRPPLLKSVSLQLSDGQWVELTCGFRLAITSDDNGAIGCTLNVLPYQLEIVQEE